MNQLTDLKMAVDATFSSILNEIQLSNLNFTIQLTPYAAYATLKNPCVFLCPPRNWDTGTPLYWDTCTPGHQDTRKPGQWEGLGRPPTTTVM